MRVAKNSDHVFLWTDGYTFLERFYSAFDSFNLNVGIANTKFTHAKVNYGK